MRNIKDGMKITLAFFFKDMRILQIDLNLKRIFPANELTLALSNQNKLFICTQRVFDVSHLLIDFIDTPKVVTANVCSNSTDDDKTIFKSPEKLVPGNCTLELTVKPDVCGLRYKNTLCITDHGGLYVFLI